MSFHRAQAPIYLQGPASFLPKHKMTNEDLIAWMGRDIRASWIEHRTGIQSRHWAGDDEACSDLAVGAIENLSKEFPGQITKVRQLLLATISGDYPTPPTAPLIQHRLGLANVGAMDLTAACAGFVTGLHSAAQFFAASREAQLLVSAEIRSKFLAKDDLAATALFGDGAAACFVNGEENGASFRYEASQLFSDGSVADIIAIQAGGSRLPFERMANPEDKFLKMKKGATLFVKAAEGMAEAGARFLERMGLTVKDLDWVVPHQANLHLVRDVTRRLDVPAEKVVETVQFTGNTSGASVGIALAHLRASAGAPRGSRILLLAAGGGGLAACALLESR
jgi:3-oxoacyl-[acyl-carrier-protein] synthase-3